MKINTHWIAFYAYLNILKAACTLSTRVFFHRSIRVSHTSLEYSSFQSLDPSANVSVYLRQHPRREYSNTHSAVYCAFNCLLDDTCYFFHFEQKDAICIIYQVGGVTVKGDGLLYCHFTIFVTCTFFSMSILALILLYFASIFTISTTGDGYLKITFKILPEKTLKDISISITILMAHCNTWHLIVEFL